MVHAPGIGTGNFTSAYDCAPKARSIRVIKVYEPHPISILYLLQHVRPMGSLLSRLCTLDDYLRVLAGSLYHMPFDFRVRCLPFNNMAFGLPLARIPTDLIALLEVSTHVSCLLIRTDHKRSLDI